MFEMPPAASTGRPARATRRTVATSGPGSVPDPRHGRHEERAAPGATSHPKVSASGRSTGRAPRERIRPSWHSMPTTIAVPEPAEQLRASSPRRRARPTRARRGARRPEERLGVGEAAEAAARLHAHARRRHRPHDLQVARRALEREVEVDDVEPAGAGLDEWARGRDGVAVEGRDRRRPFGRVTGETPAVTSIAGITAKLIAGTLRHRLR